MALTRSEQMARIRGTHTAPELHLRSLLWRSGLRYRLHVKRLPGRPDLVLGPSRVAVFVDGCFWHGCPKHYVRPRSRARFWAKKLRRNVDRDCEQQLQLLSLGWRVVRLWEHEVLANPHIALRAVVAAVHRTRRSSRIAWRVANVVPLDRSGCWERRTLVRLDRPRSVLVQIHQRHTRKWNPHPSLGDATTVLRYLPEMDPKQKLVGASLHRRKRVTMAVTRAKKSNSR
jgi:DNA mismatch endonuclease (patch repair protein)